MFVKLLTLLFSNIFVSFSVYLCYRSFIIKCSLKGKLVPVSVLDRTRAAIELTAMRSSALALKPKRPRSSAHYIHPRSPHCPSTIIFIAAPREF